MERPDLFNYDRNSGLQPEGSAPRTPNMRPIAGILGVGESRAKETSHRLPLPKTAETVIAAALQPEKGKDVQYSAWHRIEKDQFGNVKSVAEQRYGQAMLREMDAEQGVPTSQVAAPTNAQMVIPQTGQPAPSFQPLQPLAQPITSPTGTLPQPPMPQNSQNAEIVSLSQPDSQSVTVLPKFNHVQTATAQPLDQTAVNPSFVARSNIEPRLEAGSLTQDPEHMLTAPKKHRVITVLQSPWFWLVAGVVLIIYFV